MYSPKCVFQNTVISILLKFIEECMSLSLYSAEGLYTNIGMPWFVSETGISNSEMLFVKFETFNIRIKRKIGVIVGGDNE